MKIQCSCGAKLEFEITSELSTHPVRFICPECGLDSSEFVDGLVRRELGQAGTPEGAPVAVNPMVAAPVGVHQANSESPQSGNGVRPGVSIRRAGAVPEQLVTPTEPAVVWCLKHPGEKAIERCRVCAKPICPKCMALFGYVCSPLCKAKAEAHGIAVPVYAGQKSLMEARQWRRTVWAGTAIGVLAVALAGLWGWYSWFGSVPKPVFSIRFPEPAYSGQSVMCGKDKDQIVFLHGATLARYNLRTGKEIWSVDLADRDAIQGAIDRQTKAMQKLVDKANNEGWETIPRMPSPEKLAESMKRAQAAELGLHVRGESIWISSPGKLARYDWATGQMTGDMKVKADFGGLISRGDEVMVVDRQGTNPVVTCVNLLTSQSRTETLGVPNAAVAAAAGTNGASGPGGGSAAGAGAGLPGRLPGRDLGKPLDPSKVAEQFQSLPLAGRLALPATLANTLSQERALAEMDDRAPRGPAGPTAQPSSFTLLAARDGFLEVSVRLLEEHMVARSAMKAATGKSVLEGNATAGRSAELAGEFLNELQRTRGGDVVYDDLSRYQVTVRKPGLEQTWSGELVGPPRVFPLETVSVVAANNLVVVLDKSNRKLWQASLAYNVCGGIEALDESTAVYGRGPCVEHNNTLYVIDDAVLTAFDLTSGNVRWRLPSVGIVGLFFGENDSLYVNSTTASPDSIKYSRQIDPSQRVVSVVLKVDPKDGKVLWSAQPGGMLSYVSGKYVYAVQSYTPDESEEENPYRVETGFEKPPFVRIRRLDPRNGQEMWEHFQQRAPINIAFAENTIRLVFKREVQVLKFLSW